MKSLQLRIIKIKLFTIILLFIGFGESNAQKIMETPKETESNEEHKGIIGRFYENDLPVIMKFVNELPEKELMSKLSFLTVVSWKYDGSENNGMPITEVNKRMIILEGLIDDSIELTDSFVHAYSRTGNNLKEFVYYSTSQKDFMELLNRTLENHDVYPIEITFYEDKEWSEFKNVLSGFKK